MIDAVLDDFLWRALLGGMGVALMAGPLGCFVVWRQLAYFGDTLAHSALLGVALGTLLQLDLNLGITLVCALVAMLLLAMGRHPTLSTDTLLGILSHSTLAIGLVIIALIGQVQMNLNAYLFGDLLAIRPGDLAWIYLGALVVLGLLAFFWRALLSVTVNEELARVEGTPVVSLNLLLMLLMAVVIAAAMKIVGVLLITALLIIPAAAARPFARSPEQMAVLAALIGTISVGGGLGLSWISDTPAGPSVVVMAFLLFLLAWAGGLARR